MAPEHYGALAAALGSRGYGGRPDVEDEAIFTFSRQVPPGNRESARRRRRVRVSLWSAVSVGKRIAHAGPVGWFRRRHEAVRARGARSIRYAFEDFDSVIVDAANFAEGSFGDDKLFILSI